MWNCHPSQKRWILFPLPRESGLALWLALINRMWQKWQWFLNVYSHLLDALWLPCKKSQAGLFEDDGPHGERIWVVPVVRPSAWRHQTCGWDQMDQEEIGISSTPHPFTYQLTEAFDPRWDQQRNCPVKPCPNWRTWTNIYLCFRPLMFGVDCCAEIDNWYMTTIRY